MTIDSSVGDFNSIIGATMPSTVFVPNIEVVPEPSTWALIGIGVSLFFIKKTKTSKT
jgi:hypothetical protein